MGWCRELCEFAKEKKVETSKHLAMMEILAEMAEMGYESNPGHWEHKREKAESLIYGYHFTKDCAEKAVARMKNKDGSSGAYWTLEDVEKVATSMGIDWGCKNYNIYDLYYTLNMARSVYYKDGQAPQYYADLAFDFLEDKDAPEGKAKRYYLAMHCAE